MEQQESDDRATVQFKDDVSQSYKNFIQQTLETSVFIKTEYVGEQLVISEPEEVRGSCSER